jgi:DDE superfamily endonuclease
VSKGVRVSGHRSDEERMEAAVAFEVPAVEVHDRLVGFVEEVSAWLPLRRERENALVYVRGLIEHGGRKSLQPTLFRLEETPARYESVQQFLADSPWQPALLVRACAERVASQIGVVAWVVDYTGIVKEGKHSPGVKRQYSGTLGKIGNCQVAVSVHAVGERGTLPLGWQLYLPEEWCNDFARRRKAKIPDDVVFATKRQLAGDLCERAADWQLPTWPTRPTVTTPPSARGWPSWSSSTSSRCGQRRASTDRRRPSRCPSATVRSDGRARGSVSASTYGSCAASTL